jgi:hypothetical protein
VILASTAARWLAGCREFVIRVGRRTLGKEFNENAHRLYVLFTDRVLCLRYPCSTI